ncbi:MAG TPA: hypothetical protein VLJ17_15165 [Xanthobacteraceae bacterium]|nr:hypothetical protein [Xanthobacteraceae bacterium]
MKVLRLAVLFLALLASPVAAQFNGGNRGPDLSGYATTSALNTVVQAANVTTASDGTWSVTWARAFATNTYAVSADPIGTTSSPLLCQITSKSTTVVAGKCWAVLPSVVVSLAALPLTVNIAASPGAIPMSVIGRDATQ